MEAIQSQSPFQARGHRGNGPDPVAVVAVKGHRVVTSQVGYLLDRRTSVEKMAHHGMTHEVRKYPVAFTERRPAPPVPWNPPPQTGSSFMVDNRSVPANTILPHITYRDVAQASAWLTATFGFTEHYRYGPPGAPSGAQMFLHDAWVMLGAADPGEKTPAELGYGTQSLTVFVPDVDAHFEQAKSAGATIREDLHETIYGERQYGAADLDGHHWLFSNHARDVSPSEWGATITNEPPQSQPKRGS